MRDRLGRATLVAIVVVLVAWAPAAAAPEGQLTWAVQFALAPTWFDPAETTGILTPFFVLYALHDVLVKPMPGNPMAPSLAESWSVSSDGLTYEFVLRPGVRFHNGDPVTADDVKFSFERYRGISSKLLKERVSQVQVVDPRKHVEKVVDEGLKKHPIGAGPCRFASFTPGVELVLEANEQYWRKPPSVERLVIKGDPRRDLVSHPRGRALPLRPADAPDSPP